MHVGMGWLGCCRVHCVRSSLALASAVCGAHCGTADFPLQDRAPCDSLLDAVRQIKPTVLIGLSDDAPPHAFDREVQPGGGLGGGWLASGES